MPGLPEIPYTLDTVYARVGQINEARIAASRVRDLGSMQAVELLKRLHQ